MHDSTPAIDPLATFKASLIRHPHLSAADETVRRLIREPGGSAIFLVFGPTGAGKSTLIDGVVRQLIDRDRDRLEADPQLSPPLVVRAPAPVGSIISWRDLLFRAVDALGEPSPAQRQDLSPPPAPRRDQYQFKTVDGARRAFEAAVNARRPPAIFIDEAQHLVNAGSASHRQHLDFIKSLSDATESVFFLVGTYDLTAFRNLNGQLGRRSWDVHLPRYKFGDPTFRSVVNTFERQLALPQGRLLDEIEFLYLRSAGCVGILKQWLVRAFARALEEGRDIDLADLRASALPTDAMLQISSEILTGERALNETEAMVDDLRGILGMAGEPPPPAAAQAGKAHKQRVGRRSAKRDPTAMAHGD
jgi:hypothetical protein